MLAVNNEERLLVLRENDVDDLPVTLVCLPDEVTRRVLVRVDVVVVEVPILQHDAAIFVRDAAVHGWAATPLRRRRRIAVGAEEPGR
jgi:hypothetical protein